METLIRYKIYCIDVWNIKLKLGILTALAKKIGVLTAWGYKGIEEIEFGKLKYTLQIKIIIKIII